MTPYKTSLALLALLTLAACEKNKHEMINHEIVKTSVDQKPKMLSEETQITAFWDRSQSIPAGAKGKLSIIPFDESKLFTSDQISRRMLVLNDDRNNPMFVEVYTASKKTENDLNRVISNFISFDKTAFEKMIQDFEGSIVIYDKNKKHQAGFTYGKRHSKPGFAVVSLDQEGSRVNPSAEDCWYVVLTTTYTEYFSDGTSYTWSESSIVGQYCTSPSNGSGSASSDACNNTLSQLLQGTSTSYETPGINLIDQGPTTRTKTYMWKFYRQNLGIYYFESTEKGVHIKVNNDWKWKSLQHISITRSGFIAGGSVECLLISATPTIGQYHASMGLRYKIKADLVCDGFPISSSTPALSSATFINVND